MSIQAVIFDMGGVLLRTEDQATRTRIAAHLGMDYDELSALVFDSQSSHQAMVGEITAAEHWKSVQETLGLSDDEFPQVQLEFWGGDTMDEDLVNYLRDLRPRYKTALLSNAWDDLRQNIEDFWKITDAFDEIVISAEVGLVKPDPGIYQRAISDLGINPDEAVFVDDFLHNIEAARIEGLQVIHFKGPDQALKDLQRMLDSK